MSSKILRTASRSRPYTAINNAMATDRRLSFSARGLLTALMTKPPNWKIRIQWIMDEGDIGRNQAYKLIKELIAAGYCARLQARDGKNQWSTIDYVLSDTPSQLVEEIQEGEPRAENREAGKSPRPRFRYTGNPHAGNGHAYKLPKDSNYRQTETPPNPQGGTGDDAVTRDEDGRLILGRKFEAYWLEQCDGDKRWLMLAVKEIEGKIQEHSRRPLEAQVSQQLARAVRWKHESDTRYQSAVNKKNRTSDDPYAGRKDH
jgi:hypothetical protein